MMKKEHVTSVRLDEYQRKALDRLAREYDRSASWHLQQAVDRYVADELHTSRQTYERVTKATYAAELLASFQPKPWVVPVEPVTVEGEE